MTFRTILLVDLPYGAEFCFRPNGPIWIKCSEVWKNRFNFPVISAFQGNHYSWPAYDAVVYSLPLERIFEKDEQLTLF